MARMGLFNRMTKAVLERTLQIELDGHLGYEKGAPEGRGSGNSRNGTSGKSVITNSGPVQLNVPRDREGTFEPKIVPKHSRRLGSVDDMILSLYARGMTTRDIKEHLLEVYGAEVSPGLISRITDVMSDEIVLWQTRPVDAVYPIVYIDAIVVKIREGGAVDNRAAHLVIGVDVEGFKHVLGIWIAENEGAKFWQNVLNELVNRGLKDVLMSGIDATVVDLRSLVPLETATLIEETTKTGGLFTVEENPRRCGWAPDRLHPHRTLLGINERRDHRVRS
jgi:putative transposase